MSDENTDIEPAPVARAEAPSAPQQFAKIRVTAAHGAKALGFTFGKGKVVPRVPLAHAEFLKRQGEAEILEVS